MPSWSRVTRQGGDNSRYWYRAAIPVRHSPLGTAAILSFCTPRGSVGIEESTTGGTVAQVLGLRVTAAEAQEEGCRWQSTVGHADGRARWGMQMAEHG
jgi:hypothetical protein